MKQAVLQAGSSTSTTQAPFTLGSQVKHCLALPVPQTIDKYNRKMGGVDIADALRAEYTTALISYKY